ncbi:MAG: TIGR02300 family protein [Rhodobacteraceae bacterium]|nr:TIGR02300 family protein [Paracoccaceae bacterium]
MPKEEWGVKRVCPTTGKRFYDMNKDPIISPYSGKVVILDTGKGSYPPAADKVDKSPASKGDAKEAALEDDALVLDDDDDTGTVALDDLADVAANDDDED